jgi:hypothetical protein
MTHKNVYLPLRQILLAGFKFGAKSFWEPTLFVFKLTGLVCRRCLQCPSSQQKQAPARLFHSERVESPDTRPLQRATIGPRPQRVH